MEYRAALRPLVPSMEVEHERAPAHGTGWRFPLKLPDPPLGRHRDRYASPNLEPDDKTAWLLHPIKELKMKNTRFILAATGSALIFSLSPVGSAQPSPGLVRVDLTRVAPNIAQDLKVDLRQIPPTVEIAERVAAKVCQVSEETLRSAQGGSCTAEITNTELEQIVFREIKGATR
jgi:hypothetical protein